MMKSRWRLRVLLRMGMRAGMRMRTRMSVMGEGEGFGDLVDGALAL